MTTPKVSCILPNFDTEAFELSQNSIKCQTYDNLEIVPAFGSSLGEALNNGVEKASGEYFAIIFPGDEWLPEKIATQINYLEGSAEVLFSCTIKNNISIDYEVFPQTQAELLVYLHSGNYPFSDSSLVFKKELLDQIGTFKYAYSRMCVFDFLLRALTVSDVLILDTPLVKEADLNIQKSDTREEHESALSIYKSIKNMSEDFFLCCYGNYLRCASDGVLPNIPCEKAMILKDLNNPFHPKEFTDLFEVAANKDYFENVCKYLLTDFYKDNMQPILFDKAYYNLCIKLNELIESLGKGESAK